jgi:hypothetical protein
MVRSNHSIASTKAHEDMAARGQHTTDKSAKAEKKLVTAVKKVKATLEARGHTVEHIFNLSYYDMKQNSHLHLGTPVPNEDDKMSICPDGGSLLVDGKIVGIFEDKYEGTADDVGNEDKNWAGGSTIDRTFKNVNACKMYCAGTGVFPYVVFAHGCNFHPKLSVSKRLEQGNYGFPNQMVIITPNDNGKAAFERLLETITPESVRPRGASKLNVASIFIKTHAARNDEPTILELKKECRQLGLNASGNRNELLALLPPRTIENIKMPNGASDWTVDEYEKIVMKIVESTIHTEPTLFNVEEERRVGAYLMWLFMLFTFTMGVLKMCGVSESA